MTEEMSAGRRMAVDAWLRRNVAPHRGYEGAALACEVVRGIAWVSDPEWQIAVDRYGVPTEADWVRALATYGPVLDDAERKRRAKLAVVAEQKRDRFAMNEAVR